MNTTDTEELQPTDSLEAILGNLKYGTKSQAKFKPMENSILGQVYRNEIEEAKAAIQNYCEQQCRLARISELRLHQSHETGEAGSIFMSGTQVDGRIDRLQQRGNEWHGKTRNELPTQ